MSTWTLDTVGPQALSWPSTATRVQTSPWPQVANQATYLNMAPDAAQLEDIVDMVSS